jgi:hypothetical protein
MQKLIPIVLVVVVAAAGGCALLLLKKPSGPAATYEVQNLLVYPENPPVGSKVYLTAIVKALKTGPTDVTFEIEGSPYTVSVEFENEGQVVPVAFEYIAPSEVGKTVQIKVGEVSKSVTTREAKPPSFKVTKLIAPTQALRGREVEVYAEVTNEGEREGTYQGTLTLPDGSTRSVSATVGPKETKIIGPIKFKANQGGSLSISEGPTVNLEVVEPYSKLEYVALEAPSTAYVGDIEVEVRVKNSGNVENTFSVDLTVPSGITIKKYFPAKSILLSAGEEKSVIITVEVASPGSYTLQAGNLTQTVNAQAAPNIRVTEISTPEVSIVGSQVGVKVKVKNYGTEAGTFRERPVVKIGETTVTTTPAEISLTVGANEEKVTTLTFTVGEKGLCTLELGGKKKSFPVIGYQEVYMVGDYVKYSYTSSTKIPELGQELSDKGEFLLKYEGKESIGGRECRKIKREITSSQQYKVGPNYDVLYTPDTDREGFLYQAFSYRGGSLASELIYDTPLRILSFPLNVGATVTGEAGATIRNYQPIELSVAGRCGSEAKVEKLENITVAGKTVEAIKMVITLKVSGNATFRGQTNPVESTTTITRYVNAAGIVLKERTETVSKTKYSGIDITLIDIQDITLTETHLSRLTSL